MRLFYTLLFALYAFTGCTSIMAEETSEGPLGAGTTGLEDDAAGNSDWPREYDHEKGQVIIYQPQPDAWDAFSTLTAKAAVTVQLKGHHDFLYGALFFKASTEVDKEKDEVLLDAIEITRLHFPDIDNDLAAQASDLVRNVLPVESAMITSLDSLVADLQANSQDIQEVDVNLDPPPIFYSDQPAILLTFMGEPSFKPVNGADGLMFAVNTNWDLLLDYSSSTYYLLDGESWMKTADPIKGPWENTEILPESFNNLPDDDAWRNVKKHIPGLASGEQKLVFVATEPSELIETEGEPEFGLVSGTRLMYVTNTDSDLFFDTEDKNIYFLTAGRWFRTKNLQGPWSSASADLPKEFQKIPEDHDRSGVLSAVPGTPDAEAAVLLASVPQKATVSRKNTTTEILYEGEPEFVEIKGASQGVYYGINSPNDVFRVSGLYYALVDGVWFVASTPTGPWAVAVEVDEAIYSIPQESPKYNATYVRVYDSTPENVVVGYTSGYSGSYVAATGVLMFGLGILVGNNWGDHRYRHYHYRPHYYGYGSGMRYRYGRGYYREARPALYGPYGGISGRASYNPVTRHYFRGGYARLLYGSAFARSSHYPYNNDRVTHTTIRNPYGSWGKRVISKDSKWKRAEHRARRGKGRDFRVSKGKHNNLFVGDNGGIYRHNNKGLSRHSTKSGWKSSQAKLDIKEQKMLENRKSSTQKNRKKRKAADKARHDRKRKKADNKSKKQLKRGATKTKPVKLKQKNKSNPRTKTSVKKKTGKNSSNKKAAARKKTGKSSSNKKSAVRKQTGKSTSNKKPAARKQTGKSSSNKKPATRKQAGKRSSNKKPAVRKKTGKSSSNKKPTARKQTKKKKKKCQKNDTDCRKK
jgi:hypothetical protein